MLKNLIINTLGCGPIPALLQKKLKRNGVSILAYHGVIDRPLAFDDWCFLSTEAFEEQVAYLSQHFKIVHLSDAVKALENGPVDEPLAVITFDDGYRNNLTKALPILKKYNAPATIYLVTNQVATDETLWFCRLNHAIEQTLAQQLTWNGKHYTLGSAIEKSQTSASIQQSLKGMHNDRLLEAVNDIAKTLDVDISQEVAQDSAHRLLSADEMQTLLDSGLITFGAHTHDHTILARLSEAEQKQQIALSKAGVEAITGEPCEHFAYPNGGHHDYDPTTAKLLKEAGFKSCVTMLTGNNIDLTYPYHLNRYGIGSDTAFSRFKLWVHNIR